MNSAYNSVWHIVRAIYVLGLFYFSIIVYLGQCPMVGISGIVEACWGDTFGWLALCHSSRITLHLWPFDSESLAHTVNVC